MDFESLLGDPVPEAPAKRRPGRPTKEEAARRAAEAAAAEQAERQRSEGFYATAEGQRRLRAATSGRTEIEEREFHMPVSINFLHRVLGLDPMTINRRLRRVKPAGYGGNGAQRRPLYDFREVLPYLLKPKMDIGTYLRSLNPADMPNSINKAFWEAERIKNKTLIETGEAWPTERVLQVLGSVFMMVKDRIPLITEALREEGITDAQQAKLTEMCDRFQKDLHEALVDMPKKNQTPSRLADVDMGVEEFGDEDE